MQASYIDVAPVAEIRGGVVYIVIDNAHPCVCAPVHVVRHFCEQTTRLLNRWDAEQAGRVVPAKRRRG